MTPTYIFISSCAPLIRHPDGHLKFILNSTNIRNSKKKLTALVSSEIWLSVGSMFNAWPDVKSRSSFGAAPSFKKHAIFKQRAERARVLGVSFRPEISVPPTRWSSNEIVIEGRSPAPQGFFLCIHYLPIYVVTWRKYILTRSNHTLLYSILTSHAHQILAFVLTVNMEQNIRYLTYINSFPAKTNKKGSN